MAGTGRIGWQAAGTPAGMQTALRALEAEYPLVEGAGDLTVRFVAEDDPTACEVRRDGREAVIRYGHQALALRAVGALLGGLVGEGTAQQERTAFTTFGIMLDCSRNAVMTVDHLRGWLRRLALLGYTMVMLYTEDTYAIPGEPAFGYLRGPYTPEELRALDAYAADLGIEMIGCIQTLGHLEQIVKLPAYASLQDSSGVLMVGEEATYALIEKMIAHYASIYRSRRLHIGMDEAFGIGRGQYLDKHGYRRPFDILNEHLATVTALCERHGLRPMIWSDMYFRIGSATHDYYDMAAVIPDDVKAQIPAGADLVYWDYYHADKAFYLEWIRRHRALGHEPLMGSGVWTWGKFWHDWFLTTTNAGPCIDACREAELREIFFTMWGDDGGYCDFDSALAGLAFTAERAYAPAFDEATLGRRFAAVCGSTWAAQMAARHLECVGPHGTPGMLWDDPVMAPYLRQLATSVPLSDLAAKLRASAEAVAPYRGDAAAGDLTHAGLYADLLARKLTLAEHLADAYTRRDPAALAAVRAAVPEVQAALAAFTASFRAMWRRHNKPFGLEVMQIRFAGLHARYEELATQLDALLAGDIDAIPEIDASLTPPPGTLLCWGYRQFATGSCIL